MTEILYSLFYVGVLTLVFGCVIYLVLSRSEAPPQEAESESPEPLLGSDVGEDVEEISGDYHLRDLERLLTRLASLQAWGLVVELGFPAIGDIAQLVLQREEVDLYSHHAGQIPGYLERFRHSAERAGLKLHPVPQIEDDFFVRIPGSLPERAAMLLRLLGETYGVDEAAQVRVEFIR